MKLNKGKNKGKVHPSPSSSSSSSSSVTQNDPVSSLNSLLPAAILTLISILSIQDKEVLAYMIAHSLYSTYPFFTPLNVTASPTRNKKVTPTNNKKKFTVGSTSNYNNNGKKAAVTTITTPHKIPSFDCRCFECYTSYWFRWDSSPHQDLIHEAIESFEEHLTASEQQSKKKTKKVPTPNTNKSSRKRENHNNKVKKSDVATTSPPIVTDVAPPAVVVVVEKVEEDSPEILEVGSPENGESQTVMGSPVKGDDVEERENEVQEKKHVQQQQQKGLARKVLPDVIGLINSRLWNLWGPNV